MCSNNSRHQMHLPWLNQAVFLLSLQADRLQHKWVLPVYFSLYAFLSLSGLLAEVYPKYLKNRKNIAEAVLGPDFFLALLQISKSWFPPNGQYQVPPLPKDQWDNPKD